MIDNRVRVKTSKKFNLAQLDQELGGYGLNGGQGFVQAVEGSPVTEKELFDAIKLHVAVDADAARVAARESAVAKLSALGLNEVEINAMMGGL